MAEDKKPENKAEKKEEKKATPPPPPPAAQQAAAPQDKASGKAITALILGIVGIVCCWITSPVAWILGAQERKAIASGESSQKGETLATVGWILGMVWTILGLIVFVLWLLMVGLSIISAGFSGGY